MKELIHLIRADLSIYTTGSIVRAIFCILFNMPFKLLLNYRIGNYLHYRRNIINNILIMWLKKNQLKNFASDISYEAKLGKYVTFPHPTGIVIGLGSVIQNNVKIWQNVTLGSDGKTNKSYPKISNGVRIYSNAQLIGNINIGENAIVGASSVVLKDVPSNKTVIGIPGKIIN